MHLQATPAIPEAGSSYPDAASVADGAHEILDNGPGLTARIREILRAHPKHKPLRLSFRPGTYHFYAGEAEERFCFVANNDAGLRRIAFAFIDMQDVVLDGQGATFLFHGRICPFLVQGCQDICLRNFRIDFPRPNMSQGEILAADSSSVTVRLSEDYPYEIASGQLWFTGEGYEDRGASDGVRAKRGSYMRALEFDTERAEPAFMANDHSWLSKASVEEVAPGTVRFLTQYPEPLPRPGNQLVLMHDRREMFGFCLDRAINVSLEKITLQHAGAMGIIAQHCENILLEYVEVIPNASRNRVFSTYADATHFTCCSGKIELSHCRFEGMMDDPLNVHGIYAPVAAVHDDSHLEVGTGHYQQAGICPVAPGRAVIISGETLLPRGEVDIAQVDVINSGRWHVTLAGPLPCALQPGDCLESLVWCPDVRVTHCRMGRNRARGPLLSTAGRIRVEHNTFHHAGTAIKLSGDANSWFESGSVRDVLIRDNIFNDCGYGPWGRGIIAIDPEIEPAGFREEKFHRNIRIEGNDFHTFHRELLVARCTETLTFTGNNVAFTHAYPVPNAHGECYRIENCSDLDLQSIT